MVTINLQPLAGLLNQGAIHFVNFYTFTDAVEQRDGEFTSEVFTEFFQAL